MSIEQEIMNNTPQFGYLIPFLKSTLESGLAYDIMMKTFEKIPTVNRMVPTKNIAEPCLKGIVLNTDNEMLQNCFIALLEKSMDNRETDSQHPSFPKILAQLSTEDISIVYLIEKYGRSEYSQQIEQFNGADILISNSKLLTERFKVLGLLNFGQTVYFTDPVSYGRFTSSYILSEIGQQFLKACMSERAEELINEIINNGEY